MHWSIVSLPVVLALTSACSAPASQPAAKGDITPEYSSDGRLTRLSYDRNGDGKVETWGYMDGARVVRVEVDEDGDGAVDRWEYHSTEGTGTGTDGTVLGAEVLGAGSGSGVLGSGFNTRVQGSAAALTPDMTVERIERATRHDGKITRREFITLGALTRVEEDTDADGLFDKWETYENGSLQTISLDTRHRGTPDRRMVYGADGTFLRLEADETGSDRFTVLSPTLSPAVSPAASPTRTPARTPARTPIFTPTPTAPPTTPRTP